MLEKTTRINMLYDFYHLLLTEKQKEYMELYYREDYSLGEIASKSNVSRQAVYDNIKRTEQLLESYEDKLCLYKKHVVREELLSTLKELVTDEDQPNHAKVMHVMEQLQCLDEEENFHGI